MILFAVVLHMTAEKIVIRQIPVAIIHQHRPSPCELHIILDEPVMLIGRVVKEEPHQRKVAAAGEQCLGNGVIQEGIQRFAIGIETFYFLRHTVLAEALFLVDEQSDIIDRRIQFCHQPTVLVQN